MVTTKDGSEHPIVKAMQVSRIHETVETTEMRHLNTHTTS